MPYPFPLNKKPYGGAGIGKQFFQSVQYALINMKQAVLEFMVNKVLVYFSGVRVLAAGATVMPVKSVAAIFAVYELFFGRGMRHII